MGVFLIITTILCIIVAVGQFYKKEDGSVPGALAVAFAMCFFIWMCNYASREAGRAKINTDVLVYRYGSWLVVPSSELQDERFYPLPFMWSQDANDAATEPKAE